MNTQILVWILAQMSLADETCIYSENYYYLNADLSRHVSLAALKGAVCQVSMSPIRLRRAHRVEQVRLVEFIAFFSLPVLVEADGVTYLVIA